MKRNYIILLSVEILTLLFLVFNIFISSIFTLTNLNYVLLWLGMLIFLILTVGLEKEKNLYKIDIIQWIFIYVVSYFVIIYIFGFFFGFVRSIYSFAITSIIKNTLPVIAIIIFQELIRFIIISKSKEKKFLIYFMLIIFIAFDVLLALSIYNFSNAMGIFEFIFLLLIPSIINNTLFTYINYKSGYKVSIVYRLLMDVTLYLLPIYPDLGIYIRSVFSIAFPLVMFLAINSFYAKTKAVVVRKKRISRFLFWGPFITISLCMVILISGIFKVYVIAIGSGSMTPNINVGDAVIIEKLTTEEIQYIDVGHVIAFEKDNILVVHRIIDMYYKDGKLVYQTKGDYNTDQDPYVVEMNSVKGLVRFRLPYIGYPSVWLNELIK